MSEPAPHVFTPTVFYRDPKTAMQWLKEAVSNPGMEATTGLKVRAGGDV